MALESSKTLFPLNIFRMNGHNSTKFCVHFDIDKINVGIVLHQFIQIPNRVMALYSCQNFILAQYLAN